MKDVSFRLLKSLLIAYIVTIVILLVLTFLLFQFHVPENVVNGGIVFSYVFACFVGANIFSKYQESRRFLWGAAMGVVYCLTVLVVSVILNRQLYQVFPNILPVAGLCITGGMLGGMVRSSGA